ncbi:hypothetical protein AM4_033 [Lactococcus phage AM4]|uniref:Uncharacterized protein n=2 Tax=Audreyjarvisvirus AM4 TaxID=2845189 RepID=A0A1W6JKD8_9CAUD|nr:hypothetical protein H1Z35_gp033 [Lactococcus phage AM4]ARM66692.1 hypothetical protein AM4_033 [Lactococcus phage AM4]ARM66925.1 hypothetical protein AM5_072 [Lactococcus phage AM5]
MKNEHEERQIIFKRVIYLLFFYFILDKSILI